MKYCAVPTCGNSSYINYRGKSNRCSVHSCNYGTGPCKCEPPLRFFPFPTKKDLKGRERWTKLINRKYPNGESWQPDPAGRSTVCSAHFPDGQPTKQNADPILKLGYEPPTDLIRRPQPTPHKKKKTKSELKPVERWPVPLLTVEPQVVLACPYSTSPHLPITNTSTTMTAIIPQTKPKPRPPKRLCIACQNISESGQRVVSNRGRLDLQECLKQYLNLEVEQGWMCINCVRQVKTIVKKVNMFRSSVLAGQCNRTYKVSHVGEENEAVITETQSDTSNKHQTSTSVCQCSRLLTSMLSKQNVCEPMEKTRIRVIFPTPAGAAATDSESESNEGLQDSSSSEEDDFLEHPRNKKRRTVSNKSKKVVAKTSRQGNTSSSVSLETQCENVAEHDQQLVNQNEEDCEVPLSSGNTVQPPDAQLRVILSGQVSSASDLLLTPVTSSRCIQPAPITICAQPTVSDSSTPISSPGIPVAIPASDDQTHFVFTKTLNELAKYVAKKPIQEHDYAH
ncbi:uncharacterized protein LOC119741050 [Patiria miniata]|uniref:THAP-type domain-containing protein n=1 Tax=Patiria miniata TaxID=46514 RepID=A0A914BAX1_PATMI|nr:uncharacterized protein LOC119741050 [Patiria miniata]XP_038072593.1 uncharacterized protein LOC119741050 [Patiria miniata]